MHFQWNFSLANVFSALGALFSRELPTIYVPCSGVSHSPLFTLPPSIIQPASLLLCLKSNLP